MPMETPHARTQTDAPRPPSGLDIWQALKQELNDNLYPLRSVTLAPTVYHVYLHPDDFEIVEGIVPRIVDDVIAALTEEVARLNRQSVPRLGLRGWLRSSDEGAPPIEVPGDGWQVHIQADLDGELPRGRLGLVSKLTLPPRPDYGGAPTIVTVRTVFTDGRRSSSSSSSAPAVSSPSSTVTDVAEAPGPSAAADGGEALRLRASLEYHDEAGDHLFAMRKELIKIG